MRCGRPHTTLVQSPTTTKSNSGDLSSRVFSDIWPRYSIAEIGLKRNTPIYVPGLRAGAARRRRVDRTPCAQAVSGARRV